MFLTVFSHIITLSLQVLYNLYRTGQFPAVYDYIYLRGSCSLRGDMTVIHYGNTLVIRTPSDSEIVRSGSVELKVKQEFLILVQGHVRFAQTHYIYNHSLLLTRILRHQGNVGDTYSVRDDPSVRINGGNRRIVTAPRIRLGDIAG